MNTQTTPGTAPQIEDMLASTQADVEQFRKEIGNEQVSVHDRYELLKKELQTAIGQMRNMIRENKALSREIADTLREHLATLEEQAKAHVPKLSEADLEEQLTRIRKAMENLVAYLGTLSVYDFSLANILDSVYRFKIKLAILRLKLQLGALEVKGTVWDVRHDLKKQIRTLREKAEHSGSPWGERWDVFRHEVGEAYEHLQKAFTTK